MPASEQACVCLGFPVAAATHHSAVQAQLGAPECCSHPAAPAFPARGGCSPPGLCFVLTQPLPTPTQAGVCQLGGWVRGGGPAVSPLLLPSPMEHGAGQREVAELCPHPLVIPGKCSRIVTVLLRLGLGGIEAVCPKLLRSRLSKNPQLFFGARDLFDRSHCGPIDFFAMSIHALDTHFRQELAVWQQGRCSSGSSV